VGSTQHHLYLIVLCCGLLAMWRNRKIICMVGSLLMSFSLFFFSFFSLLFFYFSWLDLKRQ
jgi:hypothetical protein